MRWIVGGLPSWVAVLPLIVGVLFLLLGVRTFSQSRRRQQMWTRRTGLVVGSRLSDNDDSGIQWQITFSDEEGPVTFWNRYTTSFVTDRVGQSVEVLVNPRDRSDAVVTDGRTGAGLVAGAYVVFGVLAISAGVRLFIGAMH